MIVLLACKFLIVYNLCCMQNFVLKLDRIYLSFIFIFFFAIYMGHICDTFKYQSKQSRPGPKVIKKCFILHTAKWEFFLLANVKMPTVVGILTL